MPALDMNMNMNMAFGTPAGAAGRFRARYNTDIFTKLIDPTVMLVPPPLQAAPPRYPLFHQYWDADLRSYMYLDDFVTAVPGWQAQFIGTALTVKPYARIAHAREEDAFSEDRSVGPSKIPRGISCSGPTSTRLAVKSRAASRAPASRIPQLIAIRRGIASRDFLSVGVRTPSSSWALICS